MNNLTKINFSICWNTDVYLGWFFFTSIDEFCDYFVENYDNILSDFIADDKVT